MRIGVFCSANHEIDPDFFTLTDELGQWAARQGHTIVFGGCNLGLMGCVARAAHAAGGQTIGVIPRIVEENGRVADEVDIRIPCDNLSDRKDLLVAHSDALVALPGGIGTLDEIFTVLAAASIGYHHRRVILYNMKGFWDSLLAMLDDLNRRGVIRPGFSDQFMVADSLEGVAACLSRVDTVHE